MDKFFLEHKNKIIILTPFFVLLSHYLAVLPHEYAHSLMAWLLGYKENPWALNYGGTSLLNILLLAHIDQNVDYATIYAAGHPIYVALIAFAGSGIANAILFIGSFYLLKNAKLQQHALLYYFVFLFNVMNLGNFYDYIPIRAFASHGDVYDFVTGLNISPWIVYIVFGYLVAFLMWKFFTEILPSACVTLKLESNAQQASLMILCVCILFGFFGGFPYVYFAGQETVGAVTYFLSATSFIAIPGIIWLLWPSENY